MENIKIYLITFCTVLLISFSESVFAQNNDSLNLNSSEYSGNLLRPRLELGAGVLSFRGDYGNRRSEFHQAIPTFGYHLKFDSEVNSYLNLQFYTLFGKLSSTINSPDKNLNFQSRIRSGGLALVYNFSHFLPEKRDITPYFSLGIETIEFNSKSDLYDSEGRKYNYWDDGSIRDIAQNAANAENAVILRRDYVYETDLREQNLDKLDKYALRSLSLPIGIGVNMKLNQNVNLRLGTEMHFTFTDNIDNISSSGSGNRKGNPENDRFLYTSFGLSYNLRSSKSDYLTDAYSNGDLSADLADEDKDGVIDFSDKCPFTPEDVQVDEFGCPIDSDKDGIFDYLDEEPNSSAGSYVDERGITLTDEDFALRYLAYIDTVGNVQYNRSSMSTSDVPSVYMRDRKKYFSVQLGTMDDLSSDKISQLLSIGDIRTEEQDGKTQYLAGEFRTLEEAVNRKVQLENEGIPGKVVLNENGKLKDISDEAALAELDLKGGLNYYDDVLENNPNKILFRIQIGAYRHKLSQNIFTNVNDLLVIEGNDGLTRYVSGSFNNMRDAAKHKIDLLLLGFEGAFVTAYQNGKRISLKQAGATVNEGEDMKIEKSGPGNINSDLVKFSVQLGVFAGRIPADILNNYMNTGSVRPVRGENGVTKYVSGSFESKEAAEKALVQLKNQGYDEAFIVGEFNGQIIDEKEAIRMKE